MGFKTRFVVLSLYTLFCVLYFSETTAEYSPSESEPPILLSNTTDLPNLQSYIPLLNTSADQETKVTIISQWADQIKAGNYTDLQSFFKLYGDSKINLQILNDYLSPLLQRVYTFDHQNGAKVYSTENFAKILEFLLVLPNTSSRIYGYTALLEGLQKISLKNSSEMLTLIFNVKQTMNVTRNDNQLKDMKYKLLILYNQLPELYRQIIWQDTCYIKNYHWQEFLYGSNVKVPATNEKFVYTWIAGENIKDGQWKLEPVENASYFHIVNHHWRKGTKKYLCDDLVDANGKNLVILCSRNTVEYEQIQWKLEQVYLNDTLLFKIHRRQYDDGLAEDNAPKLTLVAGGLDEQRDDERRNVFTKFIMNTDSSSESLWEITCFTEKQHFPYL